MKTRKNDPPHLKEEERLLLFDLARRAIARQLEGALDSPKDLAEGEKLPAVFRQQRGVFVTLKLEGRLRGCIGYPEAIRPLWEAVVENAVNAALHDPRFAPLTKAELDSISMEISVLTPFRIASADEVVPGTHGIMIRREARSGLLLPQVAEEYGWDRDTFLRNGCLKAGLDPDAWRHGAEIQIFSAEVFGESSTS